ncbi:MAG TPA: xylulose 5-phosphate 3-epimerase [Sphaerochaeta sp.]|nr:xylulose 5-phosphate 3-epimerase [Sphaerochaeta sp.]
MTRTDLRLGIYEKALPHDLSWRERLAMAKKLGFDFVEMSIDETDERLARLTWSKERRLQFVRDVLESGVSVPSICLSGHRRYPLGSKDPKVRATAMQIMEQALQLALDLGIRVIQIAGYDEYYTPSDSETDRLFREQFALCEKMAKKYQVMLSFEIMDTPYLSTIDRFMELKREFRSCWTSVYPDVGNLSAWGNDISQQLWLGFDWITAIHLKDTIAVTATTEGVFKEVPFGTGCVDFHLVFSVLRELDYRGPLLIEMWTGKELDPEGAIAQARDFLLSHMWETGFLED